MEEWEEEKDTKAELWKEYFALDTEKCEFTLYFSRRLALWLYESLKDSDP